MKNKFKSLFTRGIIILITIGLISFILVQTAIFLSAKSDLNQEVDVLIILGAGLRGEEPSLTLKYRLDMGVEYLIGHPNVIVVVSGGQGKKEWITEAEAMKRYLVQKGISSDRILKEERSTSTYENLIFSKELIIDRGLEDISSIMIATSDFHLFRAKYYAKELNYEIYTLAAKTPANVLPIYLVREYAAIVKALVWGR